MHQTLKKQARTLVSFEHNIRYCATGMWANHDTNDGITYHCFRTGPLVVFKMFNILNAIPQA